MNVVTTQEYRDITGDIDTPAEQVSALLEESTDLVEEYLQRKLRFGTYTEDLEVWDGTYVYPSVTPIVSIPADATYVADIGGTRLRGVSDVLTGDVWWDVLPSWTGNGIRPLYGRVTYDGGFTHETLPTTLKRAIARAARGLAVVDVRRVVGANRISVGDVTVEYPSFTGDLEALIPGIGLALKPYKRKRVRY